MPRSRPTYPPEFREQIVFLVRAGLTPEDLYRDYEPTEHTIRNWLRPIVTSGSEPIG